MNLIHVRWAAKAAHLIVLSVLFSLSLLAQAPPSADTFTASANPRTNYGGWPLIAVQQGSNGYLQFNLAHLPPDASVTKATLRLYVNAVSRSGSFDVYQLNNAWSENSLNYSNAPALGSSATSGNPIAITNSSANQFLIIDVTPLVKQWVSGTLPNNGVALALTTSNGSFSFDSKEAIVTSHQPELIVTLAGEAGPPGPQGPQGPQGETGQQGPTGQTGATGSQGPAGQPGPQGQLGPQGPQGQQGATGQQGSAGQPGPQGQPGQQGPQGQQGPIGQQGQPGPIGPQGPQGPSGDNGTNGVSFTFRNVFDPNPSYAVNDVVTYSGSTYIAIAPNQGPNNPTPDQNPAAWTLMAQAGAPGQVGAQGPAGPQGLQGDPGSQGPAGPVGLTGAQGPQGPVGATGPQGPQGPKGFPAVNYRYDWQPGIGYNAGDTVYYGDGFGGRPTGVFIAAYGNIGVTLGTNGAWVGSPLWGNNPPTTQVTGTPSITCYLGELRLFPFQVQNAQWIVADGRMLPINSNQLLFNLLGTTFGGNGISTFGIPDYRGLSLNGSQYHMCIGNAVYP